MLICVKCIVSRVILYVVRAGADRHCRMTIFLLHVVTVYRVCVSCMR